jgi:death-on-curing protein
MRFLTVEEVIAINATEVGPNLLGDRGLLESAVVRPQQSAGGEDAYPGIHSKAAALLHSLAKNHPFIDGNKRTAVLSCGFFYGLNGWWLIASQEELIELALEVVENRLPDVSAIADRLSRLVKPFPDA